VQPPRLRSRAPLPLRQPRRAGTSNHRSGSGRPSGAETRARQGGRHRMGLYPYGCNPIRPTPYVTLTGVETKAGRGCRECARPLRLSAFSGSLPQPPLHIFRFPRRFRVQIRRMLRHASTLLTIRAWRPKHLNEAIARRARLEVVLEVMRPFALRNVAHSGEGLVSRADPLAGRSVIGCVRANGLPTVEPRRRTRAHSAHRLHACDVGRRASSALGFDSANEWLLLSGG